MYQRAGEPDGCRDDEHPEDALEEGEARHHVLEAVHRRLVEKADEVAQQEGQVARLHGPIATGK